LPKELKLFFKIIDAKRQGNDRDVDQSQTFKRSKRPSLFTQGKSACEDQKSVENSRNEIRNSPYQLSIVPPVPIVRPKKKRTNTVQHRNDSISIQPQAIIDVNSNYDRNNAWEVDEENLLIQRSRHEEDKVEDFKSDSESRIIEERNILDIVNSELEKMSKEKEDNLNISKHDDQPERILDSSHSRIGPRRLDYSRQSMDRMSMSFD
jgi:hypothetical protein